MIITKNLIPYVVASDASIHEALDKGHRHKIRTLFIVDENGLAIGTLSSGDISAWLLAQESVDLSRPVFEACNTSFRSLKQGTPPSEIVNHFTERIDVLPLLDNQGRLVSLAFKDRKEIYIGDRLIGQNHPTFIIAEIGNNHNGSVELAKTLVDEAIAAGADCVKFQLRDMSMLYSQKSETCENEDLGSQYVLDLLERYNFSPGQMCDVFDHCSRRGIMHLCTPWDEKSLNVLCQYGMSAYKVASADLTNHFLLDRIAAMGKPVLISTGMSTEIEIQETIRFLNERGAVYVLLHCNATYPTPFKDINLNYIARLKELSQGPVGYSGHERGYNIPIAAVALGARVIEKHFTLDRNMEGNDHKVSLLPDEFSSMVTAIRNVETAMGRLETRRITQGEMINRECLAKSLIAKAPIAKGTVITKDMIDITSPGKGLQPIYIDRIAGRTAIRDLDAGDFFYESDIEEIRFTPKKFRFNRPWGIPVRFHDFAKLTEISTPDFVEFHLSYKDLELDPKDFFEGKYNIGFVVHAPELFAGDHLLDLSSAEEAYLKTSLENMQRTITAARELKAYFPGTSKPLIVTNMGGFTNDTHLPPAAHANLYDRLEKALWRLDCTGVEIIAQTMPPFPWHFGGQRYHNLFVDPNEIENFCKRTGYRICFDISHTRLACKYYGWHLKDFIEKVGPHIAHLHIVDAKDIDQEGLQIGRGEIDFSYAGELLSKYCPDASFIPEIWQGHKNNGEGFWEALHKLEGLL